MDSTVTRRSLLKIPAAAAVLGAPAMLGAQSPNDTIRVAYIGVGNRGGYSLRNMLKVPGAKVVAVCDILPDRADLAASKVATESGASPKTFTDYRKLLDEFKDVDAVVVSTPDWTHREVDTAVLAAGKHLYAEKPLALNIEDCKAIRDAAHASKSIMQVGFQLRHDPRRQAAEDFIHSGGIGKVLMCHGIRHGGDLPRQIPWYFDKTKCGDIMVDQGVHILDLFTWAIGSHPVRAMGSGGTNLFVDEPAGRTVMDNYSIIFEYPGDVRVNFSHHYFDPPKFSGDQERVFGSLGSVDLVEAAWQGREKGGPPIKLDVPDAKLDSTFTALRAFIGYVRDNKRPINNVDSAFESTAQVIMGTKAIYEKRIVTWEEVVGA